MLAMAQPVEWVGSTNKTLGRSGYRPEAVVIHIMDDHHIANVDAWFNTPKGPKNSMPVSAHYGISRAGAVHQYVREMDTAWHAGRVKDPTWTLIKPGVSPNFYTIGVEHEGTPDQVWPDSLYESSAMLLADISQRWSIPLDRDHVIGHYQIYAPKPYCPGPHCDLEYLITLAQNVVLSGAEANHVEHAGATRAASNLNVRLGAPTSMAARVATVPRGTQLPYVGWTSNGQSVHGNAHWYRDAQGNYFWAGGTTDPIP